MSRSNNCRFQTLSRNDVAHVQRCTDCGCVSVHVGPLTLRLDEGCLSGLAEALGHATCELRQAHGPLSFLASRGNA